MRAGVFSLMQWPFDRTAQRVYGDEISQAVEAERLGYDSAWFAEHHFSRYGIGPAIHLTVAHTAALTSRIRLGTAVTILPFLHPLRAAEEIAQLDILCGGRLDWGAGRGYQRHEFDAFGVDIAQTRSMFDEALEVIGRAWEDGPFEHAGRHWTFEAVDVLPKPLQDPMPVWIACISPESVTWAGTHGYRLLVDQFSPDERLTENRGLHRRAFEQAGRPGSAPPAAALRQVFVGRTRDQAREIAAPALLWYYRMLAKVGSPARAGEELPSTYETYDVFAKLSGWTEGSPEDFLDVLFDRIAIVGDAAEVADRLNGLHEAGFDEVMCWMNFGGIRHEDTLASMRRFADDVRPKLP
jgi:alkanesulfonate monooxygenase SsuD/methylene tetrahydromethanopterin reductase-like flavin-dependent oxidoreductase (luciferase family)